MKELNLMLFKSKHKHKCIVIAYFPSALTVFVNTVNSALTVEKKDVGITKEGTHSK